MDKDLVKLVIDASKGKTLGDYSKADAMEAFRQACIELNGSEKFTEKEFRKGRNNGLFELIEEVISRLVVEGLPDGHPIFDFVEFRNTSEGDTNIFEIENDGLFIVSKIVDGVNTARRQLLTGGEEITVKPELLVVSFYEEMRRILSGRTDILKLVKRVSDSFVAAINQMIYAEITGAFDKIQTPYADTGTFDQAKLMKIVDHVEAATGMKAVIIGSKQAVSKIDGIRGADASSAKEDLYNFGYFGHVATTPVFAMNNYHKQGTTEFGLNNDLYIIAADDKFVKVVTEGDTYINETAFGDAKDFTKTYTMLQRVGVSVVFSAQCGVYRLA